MATYRSPGVYLTESPFINSSESGDSLTTTIFVGACERGPTLDNVVINSWADYSSTFGEFNPADGTSISYLPFAVYNYLQNGGRGLLVRRAVGAGTGTAASYDVVDGTDVAFTLEARSAGEWGESLKAEIVPQADATATDPAIYTLNIWMKDSAGNLRLEETFTELASSPSTGYSIKLPLTAINDEISGSRLVRVVPASVDTAVVPSGEDNSLAILDGFAGSAPPDAPLAADLATAAAAAVDAEQSSVVLYVSGHYSAAGSWVGSTYALQDRMNLFLIQDGAPPRSASQTSNSYADTLVSSTFLGTNGYNRGLSQVANYTPWIVIPNPVKIGSTLLTPPGGAVAGIISRMDFTQGPYQTPAGVSAGLSNIINVDAKFSEAKLAELNSKNINVIRPVTGNGICIMGGRTLKPLGVDRFIAARRTLIQIEQELKDATVFAVFENNDDALWNRLRATADRILRPVWSSGGLKGTSAREAYFITCDGSINTPQVISSGEVRMEIGVALQYPAEFIVIRLSQFDGGSAVRTAIV